MRLNIFLFIIIILNLQSCGFRPVYSKYNDPHVKEKLSSITIESINSIYGSEFYHHMTTLLPPKISDELLLKVSLNYTTTSAIIQTNSDILISRDKLHATYRLEDIKTGKKITSGYVIKYSSYSSAFAPYPNELQQNEIRTNLATAAAEEMHIKLILYFQNLLNQNKIK